MGLLEGHPEKDGVLVEKARLVEEVKGRLRRKVEEEEAGEKDGGDGGKEGEGGKEEGKVNLDVNAKVDKLKLEEIPPEERMT